MGAYLEHFSSTTHRGLGNQEISESAAKTLAPPPPPPRYYHSWTTTRGSRIKNQYTRLSIYRTTVLYVQLDIKLFET